MSNMLNTALNFMGFLNTDEDEDEAEGFEIETMSRKNNRKIISLQPKKSQPTIVHITPTAFEDVRDIAKRLQNKMIVTINLELVDTELSQRIIDFVSGSVYALDGGVMKLAHNVYLLGGQGVTLQEIQRDKFQWSKGYK